MAQAGDPKHDFHKNATDRQRFQVHLDFGRIFEKQGNFDAAVLEYQDALTVLDAKGRGQFKPADQAIAHRRMGGALDRLGRFAQAEVHYKKALKYAPRDAKAWNDLGYSYYLQSRWADSERALRTALKYAPEDERIRTNLGLTLAAGGQQQEAMPLLSQSGGNAIGHANLGYLLASSGQLDLARRQYEQALAERPDLTLARRAIAQIERQQQGEVAAGPAPPRVDSQAATTRARVDRGVDRASRPAASTTPKPPTSPVKVATPARRPNSNATPAPSAGAPRPAIPAPSPRIVPAATNQQ
jgi:Flp pilus assembly protein TadD